MRSTRAPNDNEIKALRSRHKIVAPRKLSLPRCLDLPHSCKKLVARSTLGRDGRLEREATEVAALVSPHDNVSPIVVCAVSEDRADDIAGVVRIPVGLVGYDRCHCTASGVVGVEAVPTDSIDGHNNSVRVEVCINVASRSTKERATSKSSSRPIKGLWRSFPQSDEKLSD